MENGQRSPDILENPPLDAVDAWREAERRDVHVAEMCRKLQSEGWEYWGPDPSTGAEWYVPAK